MQKFAYADGYVRIKIWKGSAERFFVLCAHKNMPFWNIEAHGKYMFANMLLRDFYHCKALARKAGIRAVVVERHGLPFFLPKVWKRSFMVIGFLAFLTAWLVSTNMLWHIRLEGNYSISEDVFMDFLSEQGIQIGMWKKDIPLEELEQEIRRSFEAVTWTSGRLDGTVLTIQIKENEKPEISQNQKLQNGSSIYALADGIVRSIYVRNGVPMVKAGSEVKKGQLLVDGKVPVYDIDQEICSYQYYDADADIGIETTIPVEYTLSTVYTEKVRTGRKTEGFYFFIGNKIYRDHRKEKNFVYKELLLQPENSFRLGTRSIGYGTFYAYEYAKIEKAYTKEEAETLLYEEFEKNNAIFLQKGVQILEKNVTIDVIMEKWALKGSMRVIMPAFTHKAIEKPEDADDSEGI